LVYKKKFWFYKTYFYFLFYTHSTVKSITNNNTTILQKRRYDCILAAARKNIDDNLQPAIDLLHSWGLGLLLEHNLDDNQLLVLMQRAADFQG
jgi:muramoyltetrapeptide carboxypeptidase